MSSDDYESPVDPVQIENDVFQCHLNEQSETEDDESSEDEVKSKKSNY